MPLPKPANFPFGEDHEYSGRSFVLILFMASMVIGDFNDGCVALFFPREADAPWLIDANASGLYRMFREWGCYT